MAQRARLTAPQPVRKIWPYHEVKATSLPVSVLSLRDRRFEADSYLASGYGIRLSLEAQPSGWLPLRKVARNWQPPRLKGIHVGPEFGTPYLSATQVFDARPAARKFLSLAKVKDAEQLAVQNGDILVTRSGTVGRVTLAHHLHKGMAVSDDLIRVVPHNQRDHGWVYAFLKSPAVRQMMVSSHYGHVIKHLETGHLDALPMPEVEDSVARDFDERVTRILSKRNEGYALLLNAEKMFESAVGGLPRFSDKIGFEIRASDVFGLARRRLEANFYAPQVAAILNKFKMLGLKTEPLRQITERVWWMTRFKRLFGESGMPYLSADDLFSLNPTLSKRILIDHEHAADARDFYVKQGWLLMACSGQTYGLNGSVALATATHTRCFFSHDIVRIAPSSEVRAGYLLIALGHPLLGRPLVIRNAYGSSIPHLDPDDVADIPVVRLDAKIETTISDAAEESVRLRDEADQLENEVAADAEKVVINFLSRARAK